MSSSTAPLDDLQPVSRRSPGEKNALRESLVAVGAGLGVLGLGVSVKANDPELLKMLVTQAPGVAASLLLVMFFLKHIAQSKKYDQQTHAELMKTTQEVHERCHDVSERTMRTIDRNTEMLGRAIATLGRVEDRVQRTRPLNPDNTGE
jgi:hypothetical protein